MNILTNIATAPRIGSSNAGSGMYLVKQALKNLAGWTVRGSSDGSTGGMDDVDRWNASLTFASSTDSWLVLESPHTEPEDRVQMLWRFTAPFIDYYQVHYAPAADYTGGGVSTFPTSASGWAGPIRLHGTAINGAISKTHTLVDIDPPYGFMSYSCDSSTSEGTGFCIAFCPLDKPAIDIPKPYVIWSNSRVTNGSYVTGSDASWGSAGPSPGQTVERTTPMMPRIGGGNNTYPYHVVQGATGNDLSAPGLFGHPDEQFIGGSEFVRFNGVLRKPFTLFNNRTRISFGVFNFPWDGSTLPQPLGRYLVGG